MSYMICKELATIGLKDIKLKILRYVYACVTHAVTAWWGNACPYMQFYIYIIK